MLPRQCDRCGYAYGIRKIKEHHGEVTIKVKCPNDHEREFCVPIMAQGQWLDQAIKMIYTCEKCGAETRDFTEPESEDHYTKFYIICPRDGERKRRIDETIYYQIYNAERNKAMYGAKQELAQGTAQASSSTPCTRCGSNLRWITEYNRWYCDRCQQYL